MSFNPVNISGDTPLHVCCQSGHMALAEHLLSIPGLNVNIQNRRDETALHIAVEMDHIQLVKALLSAGASPQLLNADGCTPLDLAISTDVESAIRDSMRSLKASSSSTNSATNGGGLSTSLGRDSPLSKSSSGPSIHPVPHNHLHSSTGTHREGAPQLMQKQNSTSTIVRHHPLPSPPHSPSGYKRAPPQMVEGLEPFLLSSSAPNFPIPAGTRERSGSFSSVSQAASHRLILMDEELSTSSSTPDPEETPFNPEELQHIIDRLGSELVDELSQLLEDTFILDALNKITSSKSFKWHSNYSRNKVEVLKYLAEFVSEEQQQDFLRHLKTKYPETIKLAFVRTPSSKKLSKKERSQKKLTMVERKIKQYEWELLPDQFILGDLIGSGSYGAVYHASLLPNGEDVAVKQLAEDVGVADAVTFMKEIAILSRLDHPNVVGFIGASITGSLALVMEYCLEGNLKTYLQKNRPSWRQKVRLARQSAEGVAYLHEQSPPIVHRDLKCQNLLVTSDGDVKVSDFGLSKTISRTVGNASKMGTLNWLAPEVLRGESHPSTAADVYAFGMVLYEIFMDGTPPYDSWQPLQIVRAIDEGRHPEIPDACDPLYKSLMLDCWAPLPEARPSFLQLCHRLQVIERKAVHRSASSSSETTPPNSPRSGSATLIPLRRKIEVGESPSRSSPTTSPSAEQRSSSLKLRPKPRLTPDEERREF